MKFLKKTSENSSRGAYKAPVESIRALRTVYPEPELLRSFFEEKAREFHSIGCEKNPGLVGTKGLPSLEPPSAVYGLDFESIKRKYETNVLLGTHVRNAMYYAIMTANGVTGWENNMEAPEYVKGFVRAVAAFEDEVEVPDEYVASYPRSS